MAAPTSAPAASIQHDLRERRAPSVNAGGPPLPDLRAREARHPCGAHRGERPGARAVKVDGAAGILDDADLEARVAGVERRVEDAIVERQTGKKDSPEAALAQVP